MQKTGPEPAGRDDRHVEHLWNHSFYVTSKEMIEYKGLDSSASLWPVLLFIPFGSVYSYYEQGEALESVTYGSINKWIVFLMWFASSPDIRFIVQTELNKPATQSGPDRRPRKGT